MAYTLILPHETRSRLANYLAALQSGAEVAGKYLADQMAGIETANLTESGMIDALLNTKHPLIFAESAVAGDGSDWNPTELGLLGDISIAMPVTIFDNGHHTAPVTHAVPFRGTLIFTPGALLRNGSGKTPADWTEVTLANGTLNREGYFNLYERRLLPVLQHVNARAAAEGKKALLTLPGLGCGQFAGPFAGRLGTELKTVLERLLTRHGGSFTHIKAVYYDPFNECTNSRQEIHGLSLMIRPLLEGNSGKPQLCRPSAYAEAGDDFSDCILFSIVAWDHVSWPGNDFFGGNRCTDDGVKAAATDSMAALTGIQGHYNSQQIAYLPPPPYRTWNDAVLKNGLRLHDSSASLTNHHAISSMSPQHYPIEEGKLYGGEYPGDLDPDIARTRLRQLITLGIRTFVDLTSPADRMAPYDDILLELELETGSPLRRISLPITDMGTPSSGVAMQTILHHIRESTSTTPAVYVHCWGGIGRTGTVVGCWLRECGLDPEAALSRVQHLYSSHMPKVRKHPESPQTPAQKNYIRNWQATR